MAPAFEILCIGQEYFTTPDAAVRAVSGSVAGQADDRSFQSVFGQGADYVGVVMLDPDDFQAGLVQGPLGAQIFGVEIMARISGSMSRMRFKCPMVISK